MVANVLVEIKAKRIDKTFTYLIPKDLENDIKIGIRVLVPFGKQTLEGFVLKIESDIKVEYELKSIIDLIDKEPVINDEMLKLGEYISKKTFSTLIGAYQVMLPSALKAKNGMIVNKKYDTYLILNDIDFVPKTEVQKKVLELFKDEKVLKSDANKISNSAVKTLLDKNIISEEKCEVYRLNESYEVEECQIKLNDEQKVVVDEVVNNLDKFVPFLLHGVTGSGKTEVYMHIIDEVIKNNKETILLVPEISLTPQMVNVFRKRFGNKIAILHSRLNDGEKYDEWRKIERKEVSIVIGARSAIFAPFTNLGLIIIDEEHTQTYKQENNPRYSAIEIALCRGKTYNCPIVMGSATPSIESYNKAKEGSYSLLTMKKRVNNQMPLVELIDMKDELKKGNRIISQKLDLAIKSKLEKKEQIILLLNRRGYSTIITCNSCGYTDKCPNCDIPLIYHKNNGRMKCHYCNYEKELMRICPECKKETINSFGIGTEKLEAEVKARYIDAKVVRMDVDTTSTKGSHEKIITSFQNGEYDILIGTQMIAKGLDFGKVTLVGVVNGDSSLNMPDFRSAERTYQLLSQVSGRSGRGLIPGEVVIQGFNIDHYSIIEASKHNYNNFYDEEIKIRKILKYPPFCNIALIRITSKDYNQVNEDSNKISKFLKDKCSNVTILGPSMANMPKINNVYYMQIIIKYDKIIDIYSKLDYLYKHYQNSNKVSLEFDINPIRI